MIAAGALGSACGGDSKPNNGGTGADGGDHSDMSQSGTDGGGTTNGGTTGASAGKGATSGDAGAPPGGGTTGATGGTSPDAGAGGSGDPPVLVGPQPITFTVNGAQDKHAISPLIYGANLDGLSCDDAKARFSFCRHASAAFSAYNWENNASNAGSADCNENNAALSASDTPAAAITSIIDSAKTNDAATVVTLPMLDYVAADKNDGSAKPDCSGDVSKSANYETTRLRQNRARKGSALSLTPDTSDAYVNQDELVAFLKANYGTSPLLFSLDNQPELWDIDQPVLRPTHISYAEQVSLSVSYGQMVKDNWPEADVIGMVGYGYLAAINQQKSPDYDTLGDFVDYFLAQMADASATDKRRLLDYVDLHWFPEIYPNGQRIIFEDASADSVKARVQAPRSLWDSGYKENSWITDASGAPIDLIHWLKGSISTNYPGTKLAISAWSYGGGKHISGAVAAADALGVFGREDVAMAGALSFSPDTEPYLIGAFEAYRNYDGQGSSFGDTSVLAHSSNDSLGAIYASIDDAEPSRMVLIAINRHDDVLNATINITHDSEYSALVPYVISDKHPDPVKGSEIAAKTANTFELALPAYSVSVLVPAQ